MYRDFKKKQELQKNDEHADDIADDNAGPGTPVAPQSPRGRNLHPDADPDDDLLIYGPDTTYGALEIDGDISPEEQITESYVQQPGNREKITIAVTNYVREVLNQAWKLNDDMFVLYAQTNLLSAYGLLDHMDEPPTSIMDSNDLTETLNTMNDRELAKLAREIWRNPEIPTDTDMKESYQVL